MNYASANGTAQAGIDYLAVSGTLAFPPGATSEQISVPVIGNYVLTPTVFFYVTLSNPVNANLGQAQATGTILDENSLVVTNTADSGYGSLRSALLTANATPGVNAISFQIPGGGVQTINVMSPLPIITSPVSIDGTTQPGYIGTPLIQLNGSATAPGVNGLELEAGNSIVQGLAINSFGGSGVFIAGPGGNAVQKDYLGISPDGSTPAGNHYYGVLINNSSSNVVGGGTGDGNVVSGNFMGGVYLGFEQAFNNVVSGNLIGTNAAGNRAVGNLMNGIFVDYAPSNRFTNNVVSGNYTNGIKLYGPDSVNEVLFRNLIGVSAQGNVAIPNGGKGFYVNPPSNRRYSFPTSGPNRNVVLNLGQSLHSGSSGRRRTSSGNPRPHAVSHKFSRGAS